MKIAFCSSEVVPFVKTGGMADVCGTLPLALEKLGQDIVIFLPGYRSIDRRKYGFTQILEDVSQSTVGKNITVYLIENDKYFGRDGIYGDENGDYADNLDRFDFYCRRTLELFKELKLNINLVHGHDWQAALIAVYLKEKLSPDPVYSKIRMILSLHNLAYQGHFSLEEYQKLPFGEKVFHKAFEFYGKTNLLKSGIIYSDVVSTVSPQYSREIQTQRFGAGLEGVLRDRGESVIGILNGLDYGTWDPSRDGNLEFAYSSDDIRPKLRNKTVLQRKFNLPVLANVPVFAFVSRLSHQKGIDLLNSAIPDLMKLDAQFVFLGIGEQKYKRMLNAWAKQYPEKIAVKLIFDEEIAHQIYAGADFFLMPSIYEPCGLSQMISLRYGTLPVVYRVGGLADTVIPHDQGGNGFVFTDYTTTALCDIVAKAAGIFSDKIVLGKMIQQAFKSNFSWEDSARQYVGLYHQCLKN